MNRMTRLITLVAVVTALGACATTEFKTTWKDPSVTQLDVQGKRVLAVVVTNQATLRRSAEDALTSALQARGVQAASSYRVIPDEVLQNKEELRKILQAQKVDGAVLMRVVDRKQEVSAMPAAGPYYGSFYGYWGNGWAATANPGYLQTDTVVSVETVLYSIPEDKLLWGGVSQTTDPEKLDTFVKEIVDAAAKEMKKEGLLPGQ